MLHCIRGSHAVYLVIIFYLLSDSTDQGYDEGQNSSIPAIIGGIFAGLLAVVIVTIAVVLWQRWRSKVLFYILL